MKTRQMLAGCLVAFVLCGCAASPRFASKGGSARSEPPASDGKEETSTRESGSTETPRVKAPEGKALLTLEGVASYYAHEFHGRLTSNGETFDMHSLTAAHRTLPFGTKLRVTNLENNRTVMVRINDRGPFKEGRIIDLAMGAAQELDMIRNGTARVRLEVLAWGTGE
ncbi:MAG: septal ring lytic transglycosylase RlpA family protein [Bacteroidota bacterium]